MEVHKTNDEPMENEKWMCQVMHEGDRFSAVLTKKSDKWIDDNSGQVYRPIAKLYQVRQSN